MLIIDKLTSSPIQIFTVALATRTNIVFKLYFSSTQQGWYFDFSYDNKQFNGNKLVLGANILRCYQNIIPFGVAIQAEDNIEPYKIDDFSSDRVQFCVLENTLEVAQVERVVFDQ